MAEGERLHGRLNGPGVHADMRIHAVGANVERHLFAASRRAADPVLSVILVDALPGIITLPDHSLCIAVYARDDLLALPLLRDAAGEPEPRVRPDGPPGEPWLDRVIGCRRSVMRFETR